MNNTTPNDTLEEYNRIKGEINNEVNELTANCVRVIKRLNFDDANAKVIKDSINKYISALLIDPVKTLLYATDELAELILGEMFGLIGDMDEDDIGLLGSELKAIIGELNNDSSIVYSKLYSSSSKLPVEYKAYYTLYIIIIYFAKEVESKLNTIPYIDFNEYLFTVRFDERYVNNDSLLCPSHLSVRRFDLPANRVSNLTDPKKHPKFRLIFRNDCDNRILAKFYYIIAAGDLGWWLNLNLIHNEFVDIFKELVVGMMNVDNIEVDKSLLDFTDILNLKTTSFSSPSVPWRLSATHKSGYVNTTLFNFIKVVNDPEVIPLFSQATPRLSSTHLERYYDIPQIRLVFHRIFSMVSQALHTLGKLNIAEKYLKSLRYFDSDIEYQRVIVDLMLASTTREKLSELLNDKHIGIILNRHLS